MGFNVASGAVDVVDPVDRVDLLAPAHWSAALLRNSVLDEHRALRSSSAGFLIGVACNNGKTNLIAGPSRAAWACPP